MVALRMSSTWHADPYLTSSFKGGKCDEAACISGRGVRGGGMFASASECRRQERQGAGQGGRCQRRIGQRGPEGQGSDSMLLQDLHVQNDRRKDLSNRYEEQSTR